MKMGRPMEPNFELSLGAANIYDSLCPATATALSSFQTSAFILVRLLLPLRVREQISPSSERLKNARESSETFRSDSGLLFHRPPSASSSSASSRVQSEQCRGRPSQRLRTALRLTLFLSAFDLLSVLCFIAYAVLLAQEPQLPSEPFATKRLAGSPLLILALILRPVLLATAAAHAWSHNCLSSSALGRVGHRLWSFSFILGAAICLLLSVLQNLQDDPTIVPILFVVIMGFTCGIAILSFGSLAVHLLNVQRQMQGRPVWKPFNGVMSKILGCLSAKVLTSSAVSTSANATKASTANDSTTQEFGAMAVPPKSSCGTFGEPRDRHPPRSAGVESGFFAPGTVASRVTGNSGLASTLDAYGLLDELSKPDVDVNSQKYVRRPGTAQSNLKRRSVTYGSLPSSGRPTASSTSSSRCPPCSFAHGRSFSASLERRSLHRDEDVIKPRQSYLEYFNEQESESAIVGSHTQDPHFDGTFGASSTDPPTGTREAKADSHLSSAQEESRTSSGADSPAQGGLDARPTSRLSFAPSPRPSQSRLSTSHEQSDSRIAEPGYVTVDSWRSWLTTGAVGSQARAPRPPAELAAQGGGEDLLGASGALVALHARQQQNFSSRSLGSSQFGNEELKHVFVRIAGSVIGICFPLVMTVPYLMNGAGRMQGNQGEPLLLAIFMAIGVTFTSPLLAIQVIVTEGLGLREMVSLSNSVTSGSRSRRSSSSEGHATGVSHRLSRQDAELRSQKPAGQTSRLISLRPKSLAGTVQSADAASEVDVHSAERCNGYDVPLTPNEGLHRRTVTFSGRAPTLAETNGHDRSKSDGWQQATTAGVSNCNYALTGPKIKNVPYDRRHWAAGKIEGDRVVKSRSTWMRAGSLLFCPRPPLEILPTCSSRKDAYSSHACSSIQRVGDDEDAGTRLSRSADNQQPANSSAPLADTIRETQSCEDKAEGAAKPLDGLSAMILPKLVPGLTLPASIQIIQEDERTLCELYEAHRREVMSTESWAPFCPPSNLFISYRTMPGFLRKSENGPDTASNSVASEDTNRNDPQPAGQESRVSADTTGSQNASMQRSSLDVRIPLDDFSYDIERQALSTERRIPGGPLGTPYQFFTAETPSPIVDRAARTRQLLPLHVHDPLESPSQDISYLSNDASRRQGDHNIAPALEYFLQASPLRPVEDETSGDVRESSEPGVADTPADSTRWTPSIAVTDDADNKLTSRQDSHLTRSIAPGGSLGRECRAESHQADESWQTLLHSLDEDLDLHDRVDETLLVPVDSRLAFPTEAGAPSGSERSLQQSAGQPSPASTSRSLLQKVSGGEGLSPSQPSCSRSLCSSTASKISLAQLLGMSSSNQTSGSRNTVAPGGITRPSSLDPTSCVLRRRSLGSELGLSNHGDPASPAYEAQDAGRTPFVKRKSSGTTATPSTHGPSDSLSTLSSIVEVVISPDRSGGCSSHSLSQDLRITSADRLSADLQIALQALDGAEASGLSSDSLPASETEHTDTVPLQSLGASPARMLCDQHFYTHGIRQLETVDEVTEDSTVPSCGWDRHVNASLDQIWARQHHRHQSSLSTVLSSDMQHLLSNQVSVMELARDRISNASELGNTSAISHAGSSSLSQRSDVSHRSRGLSESLQLSAALVASPDASLAGYVRVLTRLNASGAICPLIGPRSRLPSTVTVGTLTTPRRAMGLNDSYWSSSPQSLSLEVPFDAAAPGSAAPELRPVSPVSSLHDQQTDLCEEATTNRQGRARRMERPLSIISLLSGLVSSADGLRASTRQSVSQEEQTQQARSAGAVRAVGQGPSQPSATPSRLSHRQRIHGDADKMHRRRSTASVLSLGRTLSFYSGRRATMSSTPFALGTPRSSRLSIAESPWQVVEDRAGSHNFSPSFRAERVSTAGPSPSVRSLSRKSAKILVPPVPQHVASTPVRRVRRKAVPGIGALERPRKESDAAEWAKSVRQRVHALEVAADTQKSAEPAVGSQHRRSPSTPTARSRRVVKTRVVLPAGRHKFSLVDRIHAPLPPLPLEEHSQSHGWAAEAWIDEAAPPSDVEPNQDCAASHPARSLLVPLISEHSLAQSDASTRRMSNGPMASTPPRAPLGVLGVVNSASPTVATRVKGKKPVRPLSEAVPSRRKSRPCEQLGKENTRPESTSALSGRVDKNNVSAASSSAVPEAPAYGKPSASVARDRAGKAARRETFDLLKSGIRARFAGLR
ncbi:hypothetical protein CBOM_02479 [Ceraceosorus bombacis]|uniref:Uncharacterized protein n=1 Tax=Ceraceosorus bombacis TaxID=401625 RepID=A0A0P1BFH2_9BASI|nr:hypothetical protein CBOM_02479 [Ceraceosorus bombacis]